MAIQGIRAVKPGERLHQPLANYLIFQAAMLASVEKLNGGGANGKPIPWDTFVITVSRVADMNFNLPAFPQLRIALQGAPPEGIGVSFAPKAVPESSVQNLAEFPGYLDHMIAAIFVLYFETCSDWLLANGHGNKSKWPEVIHFARYVRNALAHGGRLEIKPTAKAGASPRPAHWKHLSYSIADHGREVLGVDFYGPDLIALMFEVDDEMIDLGAPR